MATGPQRYPGADITHWYQARWGGDPMDVNVVVLHTTEGRTVPDYDGGAMAPNLTAVPDFATKKLRWYQHFDIDRSSRAHVNLAGGVETNTLNVTQVELVGTCDPSTHKSWGSAPHIYWPEAPDWALQDVADFLAWMHTQHGVPLSGPAKWPAYPSSYGSSAGARMSNSAWTAFNGVCGHLHVPENVHGDPGAIDFARLIALAKGTPTPPQEDDVALTADDISKVADAVFAKFAAGGGVLENADLARIWGADVVPAARPPYSNPDYFQADGKTPNNTTWTAGYTQQTQTEGIRETLARVKGLESRPPVELTDADIATLASAVAANPALAEQIAEKVAVKLAERLAE